MTAARIKRICNEDVTNNNICNNCNSFNNCNINNCNGYGIENGYIEKKTEAFDLNQTVVVFWSSGTTGQPKGIMHAAKYLVNFHVVYL